MRRVTDWLTLNWPYLCICAGLFLAGLSVGFWRIERKERSAWAAGYEYGVIVTRRKYSVVPVQDVPTLKECSQPQATPAAAQSTQAPQPPPPSVFQPRS
jgi:hypothetical protein